MDIRGRIRRIILDIPNNLAGNIAAEEVALAIVKASIKSYLSPKSDIDDQIREVSQSLQRASELTINLQATIQERADDLQKIKGDFDRYSKLAEIERDKASALVSELEGISRRRAVRERWFAFGINLGAGLIIFALGVFLSDPVKEAIPKLIQSSS